MKEVLILALVIAAVTVKPKSNKKHFNEMNRCVDMTMVKNHYQPTEFF